MNNELIALLASKLGLAFDYVEQNASDIVNQYASYKLRTSTITIVIAGVIGLLAITYIIWAIGSSVKGNKTGEDNILTECRGKWLRDWAEAVLILAISAAIICAVVIGFAIDIHIGWKEAPIMMLIKMLR